MDSDEERDIDHGDALGMNEDLSDRLDREGGTDMELQGSAVSSLTGFLFGNIDEKGELDEDFLDEVSFFFSTF